MDPIKNCEDVNSRDTYNIGEQFKNKQKKMNNTDPIIKWGEGEQKTRRQHWWSSREQTKRTSNMDPIKNLPMVNRRHTDNIGDQVENKLKEWATRTPSKTGEWWTQVLRRAGYFPSMLTKQILFMQNSYKNNIRIKFPNIHIYLSQNVYSVWML